jgi:hypothetical protein
VTQSYNHAHPDSDLFNKKTREITLADYIKKVTQYPCVVVGGEPPEEKEEKDGNQRSDKAD